MKQLEKYVNNQDFTPESVAQFSSAMSSLCEWILAIYKYTQEKSRVSLFELKGIHTSYFMVINLILNFNVEIF